MPESISSIRVLVNGAKGRMGQEVVLSIQAEEGLDLAGQTDIEDDLNRILTDSGAQVAVDFTTASAAYENTRSIMDAGVRPVIGTSGLLPDQVSELQAFCKSRNLGGLIAPNFALGAVLMMRFAAEASKHLPHVEIIELHHERKADAPSGTSVKTAQAIAEAREMSPTANREEELYQGARGALVEDIRVHSVRLPGLVAHQQVMFGGKSETLILRHDSIHRESFMPGVCLACKKVMELDRLVYGLEHLL